MPSLPDQVRQSVPAIDPIVAEYAAGYVQHISESTSDPVFANNLDIDGEVEFISSLLKDAGGDPSSVDSLYEKLIEELKKIYAASASKPYIDSASRKLDRDTLLSAQKHNTNRFGAGGGSDGMDLDLLSGRKVESRVDKKKLEKAEKKIAAKLAKRAAKMTAVGYEASKLLNIDDKEDYDTFFLTVNPLELGASQGKSKDIKIENFDLYVGAGQRILSNTSLTLAYGRRYGVVGQNGIGKSTLLKALSRRELAVPKHITILYVEQEVTGDETSALQTVLDADVWRKHLLLEQKKINDRISEISDLVRPLETTDPDYKALDEERDDLESNLNDIYDKLTEIESDKAEGRAAAILFGLGFSAEAQQQPTNSFSGGWRMRLSLARALFCKPDLLLLDEPSNMLDVPSITYLSNYLQSYPSTVVVVSHDRAFLNEVATDIIHQHSERLDYYRGSNFDSFYATREERRKNQQREYENQMAYRKHLQTFIDKFRYNAAKSSEAQSRIKKLEKLPILEPPEEDQTVTFRFPDPDKLSPPVIQLQGVDFGYSPDKLLLKNVDLDVGIDSRIALVGGNGCGKTTLLKILMDQLKPISGLVSRNGRLRIGYFAQHHIDGMDINLSPVEWMAKMSPGKSDEECRRLLGAFGITGTLGLQKIALLSGGQKSRVAFACLGLNTPHILVLDEPSNHLDTAGLDALADALRNFKGGILMVSHDVSTIDRVCNEIWLSESGTVRKFPGSIYDYKKYTLKQSTGAGVIAKQ
ncbi:putative AAA family ATPase GCN20 [Sugiyamaella lignohabitans]|uniref:Putative AAA family ATPase GCN20 n=1 Tax=Sugiyamaella lignohabitans TaxID=796027 RepID=A0A161HF04_9ASCO|nr:putative AAA family ATPase GCN20 [Sugiyamaella lignohabitans]ANB14000.1 putative AAA family ATPase GCN20 [Sugiyamaella lignohabitans]